MIAEIKGSVPFRKGKFLLAKNEGKTIALFNGKVGVRIAKTAMKNIQPLSRLDREEAATVEMNYQRLNMDHSEIVWDPRIALD